MKTTMSLQDMFKNFGSLANLILQTSDVGLQTSDLKSKLIYNAGEDKVSETSDLSAFANSLPVIVSSQKFADLYHSKKLNPHETAILERLIKDFATHVEVRNKATFLIGVLDNLNDAIVACDNEGVLKLFNKKTVELHGLPDEPLPPEKWADHYSIHYPYSDELMKKEHIPLYRALQGEKVVDSEMVIARSDRSKLHIFSNGQKIIGNNGEVLGALVTMREDTKLKQELDIAESRFQTIFHQSPLSIQICSKDGKTLLVNEAWKKLWAIPEEIIQNYILKNYNMLKDPVLEANGVMNHIKRGYAGEVTEVPVIKYDPKKNGLEGRVRYVEGLIYPLKDVYGKVKEIVLIHIDVTEKKDTDEAQKFLSHVTSILISSLDYDKTIHQIAEACVPEFADACIIDVIQGEKIERLITKHIDPKKQALLERLQKEYPPSLNSPQPSVRAMRSGKAELLEEIDQEIILKHTFDKDHAQLITDIGFTSNIAVPLYIRGSVIGSISLLKTGTENFQEKDLDVAVELARRASLAIENSQLFRQSQEATQLRDDFISIASHELKTPITSMKLQFQIAQRMLAKETGEKVDAKHFRKMTDISIKQLKRISLLVEDLLDVTRITSGKLGMNMQECDISQLTHDLIHQLSFELDSLKSLLKINIQEGIVAVCDPFRMEQVLTNLISNAIRYGEDKPFELTLEKTSNNIVIKVKDNGPGISPEAQKRIFGRFERATSKNISGLGLGLFISQQIMINHNGTLAVESEPGKGSTFVATFPF